MVSERQRHKQSEAEHFCGCGHYKYTIGVGGVLTVVNGIALVFYFVILIAFADGFSNESEEDKLARTILSLRLVILIFNSLMGVTAGILTISGVRYGNDKKLKISLCLQISFLALAVLQFLLGFFIVGGFEGGYTFQLFDLILEFAGISIIILSIIMTGVYLKQLLQSQSQSRTQTNC